MIIYKATNKINNKAYIGLSQETLDVRRGCHYSDSEYGSALYFHKALRKYEQDDWIWEVLATCDTREQAGKIEAKLIAEHNTFGGLGYNLTSGGERGWTISEQTRQKMSEITKGRVPWNKGKKGISEETRKKLSESHVGIPKGPHTEETKRKMSMAGKARTDNKQAKSEETRKKMSEAAKRRWNKDK